MKKLFSFLVFLIPFTSFGQQQLIVYEDTVNHFTIGVPTGWRYGIPKDKSTTFMAARKANDSTDVVRENFSVNILKGKPADLTTSYDEFMSFIQKAPDFKILEHGDKDINKQHYKWLLESHKQNNEVVYNYVYFANTGKSVLILTMVSSATAFSKYREIYEGVALSLKF